MGERPINSITVLIVLAVYWPPQRPHQDKRRSQREQVRVAHLARCVGADSLEHILNGDVFALEFPGGDRPP